MRNSLQILDTKLMSQSNEMILMLLLTYALEAINSAPIITKIAQGESPSESPKLRTVYETKTLQEVIDGNDQFRIVSSTNFSFTETSAMFLYEGSHAIFAINDDSKEFQLLKIATNGTLTPQGLVFKEQKFFGDTSKPLALKALVTSGQNSTFADISAMQTKIVDGQTILPTVLRRVEIQKDESGNLQKVKISFNPMTKLTENEHFLITPGTTIEITNQELLSNRNFIALTQDRDKFFKEMGQSIMVYPYIDNTNAVKIASKIPFINQGQLEFRKFSTSLSDESWSNIDIANPNCEHSLSSKFNTDELISSQSFCINKNGSLAVLVPDDTDPDKRNILFINATSKDNLASLVSNFTHFFKNFDPNFKYLKGGLVKLLFDASKKCFSEGKDFVDEISKNISDCLKKFPTVSSTISSAVSTTLGTVASTATSTTTSAIASTATSTVASTTTQIGNFSNSTNSSSFIAEPSSSDNSQQNLIIGLACGLAIATCCACLATYHAHLNHRARVEAEERAENARREGSRRPGPGREI